MAGNQVATLARNTPEDLVSNHWRSRQRVACEGKQRCWLQVRRVRGGAAF